MYLITTPKGFRWLTLNYLRALAISDQLALIGPVTIEYKTNLG